MKVPFVDGGYKGRSTDIAPSTCINLVPNKGQDGQASLFSLHGSTVFNSDYDGPVRAGIAYNGVTYWVIGNDLVEVDRAGTATSRGTLNTSTGFVTMTHIGTRPGANQHLHIVDGTTGYYMDVTAGTPSLTDISDADMIDATSNAFIDGYVVMSEKDTDRWYWMDLYDASSIDALSFKTSEGAPDELVRIFVDQRVIMAFNTRTFEAYYPSATDDLFERYQGGFKETGCLAPASVARLDNSVAWLSRDQEGDAQVVMLGDNFTPVRISTEEIDYQIRQYTTVEDATAYSYQFEGHEYYVLTFPSENVTWAYDATTQEWHQRCGDTFEERERYNCHVYAFGKHLFGDFSNGNIYVADSSVGTVNGNAMPREKISHALVDEAKRYRLARFELDITTGIGGTNTSHWLSWSKDGGHTYSNEISKDAGLLGARETRLIWRRPGTARQWTVRYRTWATEPFTVLGLNARQWGVSEDDA